MDVDVDILYASVPLHPSSCRKRNSHCFICHPCWHYCRLAWFFGVAWAPEPPAWTGRIHTATPFLQVFRSGPSSPIPLVRAWSAASSWPYTLSGDVLGRRWGWIPPLLHRCCGRVIMVGALSCCAMLLMLAVRTWRMSSLTRLVDLIVTRISFPTVYRPDKVRIDT